MSPPESLDALSIAGWAGFVDGPGHYRVAIPMWALGELGHQVSVSVGPIAPLAGADVVVGQRIAQPERSDHWRSLANDPNRAATMIFEIDDDLWNIDPASPHAPAYNNPVMRERLATNVRLSDAVTVPTTYLAGLLSQYHSEVHVLPNCVDAALIEHERPRRDRLTVGWAGGESHRPDFVSVQKELTSFFRRNPDIDVHFIGADHGDLVGRPDARLSAGSDNLVEYHHMFDFDVALAPLSYHSFNRSKSDVKILEYAALGIPVVASDFGPYSESVQHGVTGFLARHPHEWTKYLRQLVNDGAMRDEFGANARKWAATRTIQANAWRWDEAYRKASAR